MSKLDKVLLVLCGSFVFTAVLRPLVKNVAAAAFIAFLSVIPIAVLVTHLYNRRKNKSEITVTETENALALMGSEQLDFFFERVPTAYKPEKCDNGFVFYRNNDKIFVAPNYKFSATTADDVARFYRTAKKQSADSVIVLGRYPTRNVLVFAATLDVRFRFLSSKKLHAFLLGQNALMPKPKKIKKPLKPSFKTIFNGIFLKERARFFLLSGLSVAAASFLTPFRVYYLVSSVVCIALAVVCLCKKT